MWQVQKAKFSVATPIMESYHFNKIILRMFLAGTYSCECEM